jgi:hypothetical protein
MPPPNEGLRNAITSLTNAIERMVGPRPIVSPSGEPAVAQKPFSDVLEENTKALKDFTTSATRLATQQEKSLTDHAKKLEQLGLILNAVGTGISQFTKYNITRPYDIMGAQFAGVARPAMERERDAGALITSVLAAAASFTPLGIPVGLAIAGLGRAGLNQMIGRYGFQDLALEAGGLENVARITQSGGMGFREASRFRFGIERLNVAGAAAGGANAMQAAQTMAAVGITGQQMIPIFAEALKAGGTQGLKEVDWTKVSEATAQGIYGDAATVAVAAALGGRAGFSQEALMAGTRRTGFDTGVMAQLAMATRAQTYLAGPEIAHTLFNMATNTTAARVVGPMQAMQMITEVSGRTGAVAAGGNEAQEMLLFQQFRDANPGATYMDFIEASRNREQDPRWLKMTRQGAAAFAGGGQYGRVLGSALGFAARPTQLAGTARLLQEAVTGAGEVATPGAGAKLSAAEVQTIQQENITNIQSSIKFQAQYGDRLKDTNEELIKAAENSKNYNEMLKQTSEIMNVMVRSVVGLAAEESARYIDNLKP